MTRFVACFSFTFLLSLAPLMAFSSDFASTNCATNRVLMLSDSQGLGPYGEALENWFLGLTNTQVQIQNLGGSNPEWWISERSTKRGYEFDSCAGTARLDRRKLGVKGESTKVRAKPIKKLITETPEVPGVETLVFSWGGNVPGNSDVYVKLAQDFLALVPQHVRRLCFWIAPLTFSTEGTTYTRSAKYQEEVFQGIQKGLLLSKSGCTLIDPRPFAAYPKKPGFDPQSPECDVLKGKESALYDGIHYPFSCTGNVAVKKAVDSITSIIKDVANQSWHGALLGL